MKNLNDIGSANGAIKERNWCRGARRVTVKTEDTKWKDQIYLKSIPGDVIGAFPSLNGKWKESGDNSNVYNVRL